MHSNITHHSNFSPAAYNRGGKSWGNGIRRTYNLNVSLNAWKLPKQSEPQFSYLRTGSVFYPYGKELFVRAK